jgi:hypothetical protein
MQSVATVTKITDVRARFLRLVESTYPGVRMAIGIQTPKERKAQKNAEIATGLSAGEILLGVQMMERAIAME